MLERACRFKSCRDHWRQYGFHHHNNIRAIILVFHDRPKLQRRWLRGGNIRAAMAGRLCHSILCGHAHVGVPGRRALRPETQVKVKCSGPNCEREFEAPDGHTAYFCSIECATYAGCFSVKNGWREPTDKPQPLPPSPADQSVPSPE